MLSRKADFCSNDEFVSACIANGFRKICGGALSFCGEHVRFIGGAVFKPLHSLAVTFRNIGLYIAMNLRATQELCLRPKSARETGTSEHPSGD